MASVETILTIHGENFDPEGENEVWVDGKRAQVLSSDEGKLRVAGPFPEVVTPRDVSVTVVSGKQASNVHSLRLVPPATLDRDGSVPLLSSLVGSALVDDTPGKERLLLLSPEDGIFEFSREDLTTKPWLEHQGSGPATAISGPDSEGNVYVSTHFFPSLVEVFEISASGASRQVMLRESGRPFVAMALHGDEELLALPENSCRIRQIPLGPSSYISETTIDVDDCQRITGMASTEESLYISIDDSPYGFRVEKRDWSDVETVEETWNIGEASTIGAKGDEVLVLSASRLARLHDLGFETGDEATFDGALAIHIVDDGLLLAFQDSGILVGWTEPFKTTGSMEREALVRIPVPFRPFKGIDAFYFSDLEGAQRLTADGEFRPLPPAYTLATVDRRGYPLVLDRDEFQLLRYDPLEEVTTPLLDLAESGVSNLTGLGPVGDSLVFVYLDVSGAGVGRMDSDGGGIDLASTESIPFEFLLAGKDGRVYLRGVETDGELVDGIWSFDARASVKDDLPDLRRDFPYTWDGQISHAFEDAKGRLILTHLGSAIIMQEIDLQRGSIRPLIPEDGEFIFSVLEEDANGRLLVMWFDPVEQRTGMAHLYR